jgi:ATP-dependent Clp protease ATP-binding subunit ClpA
MEQFSKDAEKILSKAESIAFGFNHSFVASEHLLLAILKDKNQPVTDWF